MRLKPDMEKAAFYIAILLVIISSLTLFRPGALWWDETVYLSIADNLYIEHEYAFNINNEEEFRAPVFPAMIASAYFLFGSSETVARLAVFAASLLFVFAVYYLGRKLYGVKIASSGALLAVAAPQFVFWSSKILSEAAAVLFAATTLYVIYIVVEENREKLYPLLGALLALSFLTKYPLGLLAVFFFAWALFRKKQKLFFCRQAVYGVIVFFLILTPWMYNSYDAYGSVFGSMSSNVSIVNDPTRTNVWYEYVVGFIPFFGLTGILFLAGAAYVILKKDKQGIFLLSWFLLVFITLTFAIVEKQIRYLFIALPSVAILASRASFLFFERFRWKGLLAFLFVLSVALTGFVPEFESSYNNKDVGLVVEEAGLYLYDNAPEGTMIMSQSAPPFHYYSKHKVIWFPKDVWAVMDFMYRYNVSYVEIDNYVWYPDYALNYFDDNKYFSLEYNKTEGDKFVRLYRYLNAS